MTIGVDIRVLARGIHSGIEEYTLNLLSSMIKVAPHVYFKLFLNSFRSNAAEYEWKNAPNVKIFRSHIPNRAFSPFSKIFNAPKIDKLIGGADVFFSPHFFITPLSSYCKRVTTFHDLSFVRYPDFFSLKQNIWHRFQMNPKKQAERADKIIAVSESTKSDLIEIFGIKPEKINIIRSGLNEIFFQKTDPGALLSVKKKYSLPDKYILFLGTLEPRKNIEGIIEAFEVLCLSARAGSENGFKDFSLVLAGNRGWQFSRILKKIEKSPFGRKIFLTGPVTAEERPAIYQQAKLFVYPSFFEGFGFPPLEAMASGLPVVTSNTSSLPEVAGGSALMVNPYDVEEIFKAMKTLLSDDKLYFFYSEKGTGSAKQFSWDKTARETLDVLVGL